MWLHSSAHLTLPPQLKCTLYKVTVRTYIQHWYETKCRYEKSCCSCEDEESCSSGLWRVLRNELRVKQQQEGGRLKDRRSARENGASGGSRLLLPSSLSHIPSLPHFHFIYLSLLFHVPPALLFLLSSGPQSEDRKPIGNAQKKREYECLMSCLSPPSRLDRSAPLRNVSLLLYYITLHSTTDCLPAHHCCQRE